MVVPKLFQDRDGLPLLGGEADYGFQLSSKYARDDLEIIQGLAVQVMTASQFVTKLAEMSKKEFRCGSPEWHGDLASALTTATFGSLRAKIKSIPLVPLRGGNWVPMDRQKQVYFDPGNGSVPKDLEFDIVDSEAAYSAPRKSLFKWLGVKKCHHKEMCELILQKHKETDEGGELSDLVSHAVYLFTHRNVLTSNISNTVWLLDSKLSPSRGSTLYMDRPNANFASAREFCGNGVHYIHSDYLGAVSQPERNFWYEWLMSALKVSDIPRLCDRENRNRLSSEFQYIISTHPSKVFLRILVQNWGRYGTDIALEASQISSTTVTCADGQHRLDESILPLPNLVQLSNLLAPHKMPFLEIDSGLDVISYKVLKELGVTITDSLDFYLRMLKNMSGKWKPDMNVIIDIYRKIEAFLTISASKVEIVR